jgi:hypothetical protein
VAGSVNLSMRRAGLQAVIYRDQAARENEDGYNIGVRRRKRRLPSAQEQQRRDAVTVTMLAYSAMKNAAKFMLLYSVWKPATSSFSASGRSNGTRLVSANRRS